jgi:hypothetical protein
MRPPFPGMDPWLELPAIWPDVHNRLIASIADALVPMVDPRYYVGVESRMVLYPAEGPPRSARPDVALTEVRPDAPPREAGGVALIQEVGVEVVELDLVGREDPIEETYLEVREAGTHRLVTVIEVLSPSNKEPGRDREAYLAKRDEVTRSSTHLVEIDLLRSGHRVPIDPPIRSDYLVLVSRGPRRPRALAFAWNLRSPLPSIPIPLLPEDPEPRLPIGRVLHDLIDRARYFRRLDYERPPSPPLSDADAEWARTIVGAEPR